MIDHTGFVFVHQVFYLVGLVAAVIGMPVTADVVVVVVVVKS